MCPLHRSPGDQPYVDERVALDEVAAYFFDVVESSPDLRPNFQNGYEVVRLRRNGADWLAECVAVEETGTESPEKPALDIRARNVIIATGMHSERRCLDVPGESEARWVIHSPHHILDTLQIFALSQSIASSQSNAFDPVIPPETVRRTGTVLVVGSSLSAADAVILALDNGLCVIHVFRRSPRDRRLMLANLAPTVYPEYARALRLMHGEEFNAAYTVYAECEVVEFVIDDVVQDGVTEFDEPLDEVADQDVNHVSDTAEVDEVEKREDIMFPDTHPTEETPSRPVCCTCRNTYACPTLLPFGPMLDDWLCGLEGCSTTVGDANPDGTCCEFVADELVCTAVEEDPPFCAGVTPTSANAFTEALPSAPLPNREPPLAPASVFSLPLSSVSSSSGFCTNYGNKRAGEPQDNGDAASIFSLSSDESYNGVEVNMDFLDKLNDISTDCVSDRPDDNPTDCGLDEQQRTISNRQKSPRVPLREVFANTLDDATDKLSEGITKFDTNDQISVENPIEKPLEQIAEQTRRLRSVSGASHSDYSSCCCGDQVFLRRSNVADVEHPQFDSQAIPDSTPFSDEKQLHPKHTVTLRAIDGSEAFTVKVDLALIQIGYRADLDFIQGPNWTSADDPFKVGRSYLAVDPSQAIDAKRNPISIKPHSHESTVEPGLYFVGQLVGDAFVRFVQGGVLAAVADIMKSSASEA